MTREVVIVVVLITGRWSIHLVQLAFVTSLVPQWVKLHFLYLHCFELFDSLEYSLVSFTAFHVELVTDLFQGCYREAITLFTLVMCDDWLEPWLRVVYLLA